MLEQDNMEILILAAGYGTRLYPITLDIPKALLQIGGKYLLDFLVNKAKPIGNSHITVVTNEKFYGRFLDWSKQYSDSPIDILNDQTQREEDRLGSIGDIEFAIKDRGIQTDCLVLGSDNIFSWDLKEFVDFAQKKNKPVVGLYDVSLINEAKRFGIASLDSRSRIIDFKEKPEQPESTLAGTCIYYFPADSLSLFNEYSRERKDKDTTGQYISWLCKANEVYGYTFDGKWLDVGTKEALEKAKDIFGASLD